jgi:hypothetical protein
MRFLTVTITLGDVSPMAIVAVQVGHGKGGCPYPDHHFIDVLAKVGHVKNPTSIVQVRIDQVGSETFQHGQRDLFFIRVHETLHCEQRSGQRYRISSMHLNLCSCEHWGMYQAGSSQGDDR